MVVESFLELVKRWKGTVSHDVKQKDKKMEHWTEKVRQLEHLLRKSK